LRIVVGQSGDGERVIGEMGRGARVGEFALLTDEPRSATIVAIRDSFLLKLSRAHFTDLVERYPRMAGHIARNAARGAHRGVRSPGRAAPSATSFALIATGDDAPLAGVARLLAGALAALGLTLHLSSAQFDRAHGRAGLAQTPESHPTDVAIVAELSEQERRHRFVLYETDPICSPWTRRCVRQADRILLVGHAGADPSPGACERALRAAGVAARTELVLVQPDAIARPAGTARWLESRGVAAHHHLRLAHGGDLGRLARRLTSRAIGLVFGGGGARGFAHIGALRALEQTGIEVDLVGGTSMGALMAAGHAMDFPPGQLRALAETFGSRKALLDYTLPLLSFVASRKVTDLYRHVFGAALIEGLWRPFCCISANLTRATAVVHESGPLSEAVRASTAIPGIFAPMLRQGEVLVDGGVVNNFPLDVMRERIEDGLVVGVTVSPATDKVEDYNSGSSVSGWRILWSRLNPLAARACPRTLRPAGADDGDRRHPADAIAHLHRFGRPDHRTAGRGLPHPRLRRARGDRGGRVPGNARTPRRAAGGDRAAARHWERAVRGYAILDPPRVDGRHG
jgi:lysophospholipid hydrolase